ncbi:hypothetical protein ACFL5B_03115 [Candidatus Latescibacterota bacterium]
MDIDIAEIGCECVSALTSDEADAVYRARKNKKLFVTKVNTEEIETIIDSLDKHGAWVEDIRL